MSFASPLWLLGLLGLPALVLWARAAQSRGRRYAIRFPAAASLRAAGAQTPIWLRLGPAAVLLLALALMILALARPQATVAVPVPRADLVLVTDHSGSMQATDVVPDRLDAAKAAAHLLINRLPSGIHVGVVGYSTVTDVVQAPTGDHGAATRAIDVQAPDGETATGDALAQALVLISSDHVRSAAIVLISDGATNAGQDPVSVAQAAAGRHIPIYTVALGTPNGTLANPDPYQPPVSVPPDPVTLARIARVSGARGFTAESESQLTSIYSGLSAHFATRQATHQITEAFAIGALVLLIAGLGLAQAGEGFV